MCDHCPTIPLSYHTNALPMCLHPTCILLVSHLYPTCIVLVSYLYCTLAWSLLGPYLVPTWSLLVSLPIMAKVHIPPGSTFEETAAQLATIGITLDRHQLPDGTYRAYTRKDKLSLLLNHLNQQQL